MRHQLALALLLVQTTRPADAVAAARAALDQVLARGKDSREAADAWRTLARAEVAAGNGPGAVAANREELAIRKGLGERPGDAMDLLICHFELGNALRIAEQYTEALAVLERTRPQLDRLDELRLDPQQRALMRIAYLHGSAQVRCLLGDNAAARPLLEEALKVAIEGLGETAPNTQVVRQSLALVVALAGQVERARELAAQALAAAEAVSGPEHLKTAHAAYVLGTFLRVAGRPEEAAPLLERALRIRREQLGAGHADTIAAQLALAPVLYQRKDLAAVRTLLGGLLEVARANLGPDHPMTITVEAQLAELLVELGEARAALPLARHALACRLAVAPGHTPGVLNARLTVARALHALARHDAAVAELEQALESDDGSEPQTSQLIRQRLANFLPAVGREQESLALARENLRVFPLLLASYLPALLDTERVEFASSRRHDLDHVLTWSSTADEVAEAHRDAIAWKAQVARGLFAERAWLRRHLEPDLCRRLDELQAVVAALADAHRSGNRVEVERLTRSRKLIEQSIPARAEDAAPAADPQSVYARLGPGDALVDLYVYEKSSRTSTIGTWLMAFVVAGGSKRPVRVDLGPLEPVAAALQAHLQLVARRTTPAEPRSRASADAVAARARSLLWQPLASHLAGKSRVFVCADGATALLPLATLPGDEPGTFLVERYEFRSLVSPMDLLPATQGKAAAGRAVLVGNVDYGSAAGTPRFAPLSSTEAEIRTIGRILAANAHEVVLLRGADASAARLTAAVAGARLVHLATHGEFATQGLTSERPGQRGGIALAGANTRGLFTTDELAWLDLHACDLAVLSACDTGLGEPTIGEHVLGLRRALRLAGARTTLTSAWRIDDAATGALMADFYRRLCSGADPATALREAQLELLTQNRKTKGDAMPGIWGAFVIEGCVR